jgi:hypothetical protein
MNEAAKIIESDALSPWCTMHLLQLSWLKITSN